MTSDTARTVANVVLASAGLAAVYVVMTSPPLRRLAMRAVRVWLGATVPAYLVTTRGMPGWSRPAPPDIMAW